MVRVFVRSSALAALLVATILPAHHLDAQTAKLRVAAIPIDISGASIYAVEMGFFKKHGLDVDLTVGGSGPAVAAAVIGGSLDIGSGNSTSLATGHERGVPLVLVAPSGAYSAKNPSGELLVLKTSPLKAPKDLVGKTVGIGNIRAISEVAMRAWLDQNGVDNNAVKFVEIPFSQMGGALTAGRVDAVLPEEPALSAVLANGDSRRIGLPNSAIAALWVEGGYFCTLEFAKAHPDIVKNFADAIAETDAWANKNHDATAKILAKYGLTVTPQMHRVFYPERLHAADLQPLIDASAKYGVLKATFPAQEMFAPGIAG